MPRRFSPLNEMSYPKQNPNKFSIVIPTANRVDDVISCLNSLQDCQKNLTDYSVYVIDNNYPSPSTCLKSLCASYSFVNYTYCSSPGLSAARHHALKVSDSEVLCFVDDDVRFTPRWLCSNRQIFLDSDVALAGGPSLPYFTDSVPPWFWEFLSPTPYGGWQCGWLSLIDIGKDIDNINPGWIWGLNFSIRRDVLVDCGGFHVDLVPKRYARWQGDGESGLTMKIAEKGYKSVYRQDSLLFHHCGADRLRPDYFEKRAYYQGVCNSFTVLRRQLLDNHSLGPTSALNNPKNKLCKNGGYIAKRLLKSLRPVRSQSPWAEMSEEIRARCQAAERRGYVFHQKEALNDPLLQDWIKRPTFFDVDLRCFSE